MNSLGTGAPITLSVFCRFDAKPNSSAARVARMGFHWPKMTAARAMKPVDAAAWKASVPAARADYLKNIEPVPQPDLQAGPLARSHLPPCPF
mgnify:CR=1 FL=1